MRSRRVHSRYARQLHDLPCIGHVLRLVCSRCAPIPVRGFRLPAALLYRAAGGVRPSLRAHDRATARLGRACGAFTQWPPRCAAWAHAGNPAEWNDADPVFAGEVGGAGGLAAGDCPRPVGLAARALLRHGDRRSGAPAAAWAATGSQRGFDGGVAAPLVLTGERGGPSGSMTGLRTLTQAD